MGVESKKNSKLYIKFPESIDPKRVLSKKIIKKKKLCFFVLFLEKNEEYDDGERGKE